MVSRSSLSNSFLNKAKILDADIDKLNVKNLVIEESVENETIKPDFDVIVIGGGASGITAAVNLSNKLGSDKKIALFTDAPEMSQLDFYKTYLNIPSNLPKDTPGKSELINRVKRGHHGTCGSLMGGYSTFNYCTYDLKQDDVSHINYETLTEEKAGNPFNVGVWTAGGYPLATKIGGYNNLNAGIAIVEPNLYKIDKNKVLLGDVDIDLRLELEEAIHFIRPVEIFPNFTADNPELGGKMPYYIDNFTDAVYEQELVRPSKKFGMLIEPEYYFTCGRINYQKRIHDAQEKNKNLTVFYKSEVKNLDIIKDKDGNHICKGVIVNDTCITASDTILCGNWGSLKLLMSQPRLKYLLPGVGKGFTETQGNIFSFFAPNIKKRLIPDDSTLFFNNTIIGSFCNFSDYTGHVELLTGVMFNLDIDVQLLCLAGFLSRHAMTSIDQIFPADKGHPSYGMDTYTSQLLQALMFLQGQRMRYPVIGDRPWAPLGENPILQGILSQANAGEFGALLKSLGGKVPSVPTGTIGFNVFLLYSGVKYSNYISGDNNSIEFNYNKDTELVNPNSTLAQPNPEIINKYNLDPQKGQYYDFDQNFARLEDFFARESIDTKLTLKHYDFIEGTPPHIIDEFVNDIRSLLDNVGYYNPREPTKKSLRFALLEHISDGITDFAKFQDLSTVRPWEPADLLQKAINFEDNTQASPQWLPPDSGGIDNTTFLTKLRKCSGSFYHHTRGTAKYINLDTFEFNEIGNLYSGDLMAWPYAFNTSTTMLTSSCAIRASNSVITKHQMNYEEETSTKKMVSTTTITNNRLSTSSSY